MSNARRAFESVPALRTRYFEKMRDSLQPHPFESQFIREEEKKIWEEDTGWKVGKCRTNEFFLDFGRCVDHVFEVSHGAERALLLMPFRPFGAEEAEALQEWCDERDSHYSIIGRGWWHIGTLAIIVQRNGEETK